MLYQFLRNLPEKQAIGISIASVLALSYVAVEVPSWTGKDNGGARRGEPRTTAADWIEASEAYKAAQNMNPISKFKN